MPGAFTPTCQEQHLSSYLSHLDDLKAKGVDQVIFIASNDAWVMSAWGKANGVSDEKIVCPPYLPPCASLARYLSSLTDKHDYT